MKTVINICLHRTLFMLLLAVSVFLWGCEQNSDMDLPLAVDSNELNLKADGGYTNIMIYADGEWKAEFSEHVKWASLNTISGSGRTQLGLSYAANYGVLRAVDLIITHGGRTQVIKINQAGDAPLLNFTTAHTTFAQNWEILMPLRTNLEERISEVRDSIVYIKTTLPGEDPEDIPEIDPTDKWISNVRIGADSLLLSTSTNAGTRPRTAKIYLLYKDAKKQSHIASTTLVQYANPASLKLDRMEVPVVKKGGLVKLLTETNLDALQLTHISFEITYTGDSSDWITEPLLSDGNFTCQVLPNDSGSAREATISMTLYQRISETETRTLKLVEGLNVKQSNEADIRMLISGATGTYTFTDAAATLDGVVISDAGNANVETNINDGHRTSTNYTPNKITAYVQMFDGSYGFRIQALTEEDNTFERYSRVKISLNGLTLTKEANPERYTLSGLSKANILSATPSAASEVVTKEKYIAQLTDDDLYTFVTLKDIEIAINDGSYTNINEGYAARADCTPLALRDNQGSWLYMLTNAGAKWRREGDGVAKGSGKFSGILVHSQLLRYGVGAGDVGRYQIRPLTKEDIALTGPSKSSTLVEWNWNDHETTLNQNTDGTLKPDLGNGALRCTNSKAKYARTSDFNGLKYYTDNQADGVNGKKGELYRSAMAINETAWWDYAANKGYAIEAKFSTRGAGDNLCLNFSMVTGNGGGSMIYAPVYWQVEYSTDGTNFTVLPNSTFGTRPFVWWSGKMPLCCAAGYCDHVFALPASLQGQANVYIRLQAQSTICMGGSEDDMGESGTITTANDTKTTVRLGAFKVTCNK